MFARDRARRSAARLAIGICPCQSTAPSAEDMGLTDRKEKGPVIAVDGPAASGKGTIARALAAHFGLPHMDTGLLYRAVALNLWRWGGDPGERVRSPARADMLNIDPDDEELRSEPVSRIASSISAYPSVRAALLEASAGICRAAGRGGARRARHRHGDCAGRRREAVRHRVARSARAAARARTARARHAGSLSKTCSPISGRETRATARARSRRSSRRRCDHPRHQRSRSRGGDRRSDPARRAAARRGSEG